MKISEIVKGDLGLLLDNIEANTSGVSFDIQVTEGEVRVYLSGYNAGRSSGTIYLTVKNDTIYLNGRYDNKTEVTSFWEVDYNITYWS